MRFQCEINTNVLQRSYVLTRSIERDADDSSLLSVSGDAGSQALCGMDPKNVAVFQMWSAPETVDRSMSGLVSTSLLLAVAVDALTAQESQALVTICDCTLTRLKSLHRTVLLS